MGGAESGSARVSSLHIDVVSSDEGPVLLRLSGELDWGSAEALRLTIEHAFAEGRSVVLDVGHLHLMDSTGLGALLRAKHHALLSTLDFRVEGHHGAVASVMSRTGTLAWLTEQ
jgi:anti-anti-sigma factor